MGIGGQGPLAGLATATRIPTRTPISMVGNWTIYFSWDCTGNYSSGELTFYSDNTYNVNDDPALWGTWFTVADYVDFTFDEYPNSHYIGTLSSSGDYTEGTMDNLDEMSGCWYASR